MPKQVSEKEQNDNRKIARTFTLVMQFGINMLVPIFLCFFAGLMLDRWLGTSYLVIIFFFIGAIAGFRNVYVFSTKMEKMNSREKTTGELEDEEILRQMKK